VGEIEWIDLAVEPVSLDPDVNDVEVEFDLKYSVGVVSGADALDVYVGFTSA
jgi:hypothetical protein